MPSPKQSLTNQASPSMAQIAKLAGVGKMTVSRALRGQPYVSEEKRELILRVAEEIGYHRSNIVSTVMSQMARSRAIDYATPLVLIFDQKPAGNTSHQMVHDQVLQGARKKAEQLGFPLEVMYYNPDKLKDNRLDSILETRGIQGVAINVIRPGQQRVQLSWDRLTGVTLGGRLAYPETLPQVHGDVSLMMNEAYDQLRNRGYERIGFIGQYKLNKDFRRMYHASVSLQHSMTAPEKRVEMLGEPEPDNDDMVIEWFNRERPDAIICGHSAPLKILRAIGKEAPRDFGFLSLGVRSSGDDISGIYLDRSLLAETAIEIIAKNVLIGNFGLPEIATRVLLQGTWEEGSTVRSVVK